MKKIYLVPHTHWDREWYFTKDTSNVLLHNMIKEFVKYGENGKLFLDGQNSLIDDYLKWNPNDKQNIINLIKKGNLSLGPLYSQIDVFNSQAETIFRNFEIGQQIAHNLGVETSKVVYMPDTFGFNQNLPQIFKKNGYNQFVFWRGASKEQLKKSNIFYWEGIDGTKIKTMCMLDGYFSMGMYFPYNNGTEFEDKTNPKYFYEKLLKRIEKISKINNEYILPLGGDQAPYMYGANKFMKQINQLQSNISIVLISNYDNFFKKINNKLSILKGDLRNSHFGKIHITIASSRYDIKNLFRIAEDKLFYLLEPLELTYSKIDRNYDFETYKIETILKPLFIAQTHDSLGGCNTDDTNKNQITRLNQIHQNIDSQIDLIMKKIIQEKRIENENLLIFNSAPFQQSIFERKIIYSATKKNVNINNNNLKIHTLNSQNISLTQKPLYMQDVIIYAPNLMPLEFQTFKTFSKNSIKFQETKLSQNIQCNKEELNLIINNKKIKLSFDLIQDKGDSYNFSPGKKIKINTHHIVMKNIKFNENTYFIHVKTKLHYNSKTQIFNWDLFVEKDSVEIQIKTNNKIKNAKLSLNINYLSDKIHKSQNLAITEFITKEDDNEWADTLLEYPAHVDVNDGLVALDNLNVLTKGNNEIFKIQNGVKLTLFRSYPMITQKAMKWRPTLSGLNWKEKTPDSLLQKELKFQFNFNFKNKMQALNEFKYKPYSYKVQERNFNANKMSRFVINNILDKQNIKMNISFDKKVFLSSCRRINNDIELRFANMYNKNILSTIQINGKKKVINFKPYQIKEYKIKGVYNNE